MSFDICGVCIDDNVIKLDKSNPTTYGDYATQSLGVTLPSDTNKIHITNEYVGSMSLSDLVSERDENDELKYNQSIYKLQTDDLTNATDNISGDTIYYFGFKGEKAVSITPEEGAENTKAIFKGDNSEYAPKDKNNPVEITLPNEVEFGANDSLFPFTQTYIKGTFSAGGFTNTIPAGAEVKFTSGFTLGKGHTLIVSGTLIG